MSESRYSQRIPRQTWELHKQTILRLYLLEKKPLTASGGVRDIMLLEHGFSATKSQYETRLKKWGCSKYTAAPDRRSKAPVPDDQRVHDLATEQHTRGPESASPNGSNPFAQHITIQTSSPQLSNLRPSPRSHLPRSISSSLVDCWPNVPSLPVRSVNIQSSTSQCGFISSISHDPTWTLTTIVSSNDPFHSASHMSTGIDTCPASPNNPHIMNLPQDFGSLPFSTDAIYAGGFITQNDFRLSNSNNFPNNIPRRQTVDPGLFSIFDFANSIFRFIPHMHSRAASSSHLVILGDGSAFDSALGNKSHPSTLELIRQQSIDYRIIYMIFQRLINDSDAVSALDDPMTELDQVFKAGVMHLFSLGKRFLRSLIESAPSPFNLALEQNIFRAALVLDNGMVLNVVLEMDQVGLANRILTLEGNDCYPLEYAATEGHLQAIHALLDHGADPNLQTDGTDFLQMILGMQWKRRDPGVGVQILRLLIAHGLEPIPRESVYFMRHGSRDELLLLATHCVDKSFETFFRHDGLPTILLQEEWDDPSSKTLKLILDKAFVESNGEGEIWKSILSASLSAAILRSRASAVDVLLSMGAIANTHCLISAAQSNNVQILEDFLSRGMDPNSVAPITPISRCLYHKSWGRDKDCTALSVSIMNRSRGAFRVLQEQGFVLRLSRHPTGFASAFVAACQAGDSALVEQLLSSPNFPRKQAKLEKAIEAAMEENQYHIIEVLLSAGMKPNARSLELAIQKKQLPTVILVAKFIDLAGQRDVPGFDEQSNPIIWEALRWGDQTAIEHIVRAGHRINVSDQLLHGKLRDWELLTEIRESDSIKKCQHTPLGAAILGRNTPAMRIFMACGVQAVLFKSHRTSYDLSGGFDFRARWIIITPLAAATFTKDLSLIREILRIGADPFDNSALFICAMIDSKEEVVMLLLSAFKTRYPDGAQSFGSDALYQTIRRGNTRLLELLAENVDLIGTVIEDDGSNEPRYSLPDVVFTSPLGEAVRQHAENKGTGRALEHLLPLVKDLNAVVHKTYKQGYMTSLLYAISLGSLATVQKLYQAGADIKFPAEWQIKRTPLQAASEAGSKDIVEYLLHEGASPDEPPAVNAGATALQLAAIKGNIGVVEILRDAGADINAPPAFCDGRTAFEGATEHGRLEMMIFLVDHGANLLANNGAQYRRAVEFAEDNHQHAAKELANKLYEKALAEEGMLSVDMGVGAWAGGDVTILEDLLQ